MTASIDGSANDGASGEGDDIGADVERIRGGSGADTLSGDANANTLYGAGGNDTWRWRGQRHAGGRPRRRLLAGGTGTDLADYVSRTLAVTASIDGSANDGANGEGDASAPTSSASGAAAATTRSAATRTPTRSTAAAATTPWTLAQATTRWRVASAPTAGGWRRHRPGRLRVAHAGGDGLDRRRRQRRRQRRGRRHRRRRRAHPGRQRRRHAERRRDANRSTAAPATTRWTVAEARHARGGLGADVLAGGTGTDLAQYASRTVAVTASIGRRRQRRSQRGGRQHRR